jgi:hypothetical protein
MTYPINSTFSEKKNQLDSFFSIFSFQTVLISHRPHAISFFYMLCVFEIALFFFILFKKSALLFAALEHIFKTQMFLSKMIELNNFKNLSIRIFLLHKNGRLKTRKFC